MKRIGILLLLLAVVAGTAGADDNTAYIEGPGILVPSGDTDPCGFSFQFFLDHDGTTENAFTWQLQGVVPPDYGAFAEGYSEATGACGIELLLTHWGTMTGTGTIDLFIWEYDVAADNPGAVLSATPSVPISGIGYWPTISVVDLDCADAYAGSDGLFAGYWPRSFEGVLANFGCAMDQNGPGGVPRTNIAPGIGYPTGWANPSVAGYALQAFGIGVWSNGIGPVPTSETTWGRIKGLYR